VVGQLDQRRDVAELERDQLQRVHGACLGGRVTTAPRSREGLFAELARAREVHAIRVRDRQPVERGGLSELVTELLRERQRALVVRDRARRVLHVPGLAERVQDQHLRHAVTGRARHAEHLAELHPRHVEVLEGAQPGAPAQQVEQLRVALGHAAHEVGGGEGAAEVLERGRDGVDALRRVGGLTVVVERLLRVAGGVEVARELARALGESPLVDRLERLAHASVQEGPPRRRQLAQDRLVDQRVGESVAPDRARLLDQHLPHDRAVEQVQQRVGRGVHHRSEHVEVELAPRDGRHGERAAAVLPEAGEPAPEQVLHALR
jgi:hypothetical protein